MDYIQKTMKPIAEVSLLLVLLVFSFVASAESSIKPTEQVETTQQSVSFIRDKNYACTQCHKDQHDLLQGAHAKAMNKKTGRNVGCIDCHNDVGPEHRNGAKNVVKFNAKQTVAGTQKPVSSPEMVSKQNGQCLGCHEVKQLRKGSWTHDVHALKLSCSSCHKVHPTVDPIKGIKRKPRIQMCVDCHSDMTKHKKQEEE